MAILKKSCDKLPTQEIENASECSSQHLKIQSYQGFSSFIKYKMSVKEKDTHFKCRDSVLTVSIQGLQRVRASVLTVSNQFSYIDC